MQNHIDTLRLLNYELVRELGLFKRRANLSFSQRHTLHHIANNSGLSIQELAELLYVEHSTMSRNIKKLVQENFVELYQDEEDKRRKIIVLTKKGEACLSEATASINQTISKILKVPNEEEIESIITGIRKYTDALKANGSY